MSEPTVVLLTGASQGIGHAAATVLVQQGYRVFGTSRHLATAVMPEGVEGVELDVTSDASVARGVAQVIERAGRIDVLVNNAGYSHVGPVEDTSLDQLAAQFDTNVYGVHRMIQAVLPAMIARGAGRIVNTSSGIGRVAMPYLAIYCSSKFALEGYSEGLSKELAPLGVKVVIVEPGATATEFHAHSTRPAAISAHYLPAIAQLQARMTAMFREHADKVDVVAQAIFAAVRDPEPALRYVCTGAQGIVSQRQ